MSITQRSKSINSFFDKYVSKKTSLKEFVEKYKLALHDRQKAEMQVDFNHGTSSLFLRPHLVLRSRCQGFMHKKFLRNFKLKC